MTEWEGRIADELELAEADVAEIKHDHVGNLNQQKYIAIINLMRV